MAVVKSNAYGHGIVTISKFISKRKLVSAFAVDEVKEAVLLRKEGIKEDILILRRSFPYEFEEIAKYNLIQAVDSKEYAEQLNCYGSFRVHLEIDTGMGRTGLKDVNSICVNEIEAILGLENLSVEGIFTHLSSADGITKEDEQYTKKQIDSIKEIYASILSLGIQLKHCHFLNSAGVLYYNDATSTYVRIGILLYGLSPNHNKKVPIKLHPVISLKAKISYVKDVDKGTYIGYDRTFCTEKKSKIATIPVGYAHGYPRSLSNKSQVIINGVFAPTVGNICMSQLMIDVTNIGDVNVGDIVILVGSEGERTISLDSLASNIGTISYELACNLSSNLPRVIVYGGKIVEIQQDIFHH